MVGVDQQDSSSYPYSPTSSSYPAYRSGYIKNCYRVMLPSQYTNGQATMEFDFAVIEFGDGYYNCGYTPGQLVGHLGFSRPSDDTIEDGSYKYIYGYPTGDDYSCAGGYCYWPSIWGIGNSNTSAASNGYVIEHETDATNGESGAGMYYIHSNGTRYPIGIHKGSSSNFFTLWNTARRITTSVWNFVQTYSAGVSGAGYVGESGAAAGRSLRTAALARCRHRLSVTARSGVHADRDALHERWSAPDLAGVKHRPRPVRFHGRATNARDITLRDGTARTRPCGTAKLHHLAVGLAWSASSRLSSPRLPMAADRKTLYLLSQATSSPLHGHPSGHPARPCHRRSPLHRSPHHADRTRPTPRLSEVLLC
jgi:hypothetical protein